VKQNSRLLLIFIAIALLPAIVFLQMKIDPRRAQFQPGKKGVGAFIIRDVNNSPIAMPAQLMAGALVGFREVTAGLLWVRCDEFFDAGDYDAIVPLIRLITWLDPHQVDVYDTGAWHLAYNFIDSGQHADYRYIQPAIALLKEGVSNNQGVSDIETCLGFDIYNQKALDYKNAAYWLLRASKEKDSFFARDRLVAHAYEKNGEFDKAERQWLYCIASAQKVMDAHPNLANPYYIEASGHFEVSRRNLDEFRAHKIMYADLAKNRTDVGFEATCKRLSSHVFEISGKANLPDGSRINVELCNRDYKEPEMKSFSWNINRDATVLVDKGPLHGLFVEGGKFRHKYNLSRDIKQYPFKQDQYVLKLTFNPREAPEGTRVQTGWSGEGLTDKKYLDTSIPGLRRIQKVIYLQRKDLI